MVALTRLQHFIRHENEKRETDLDNDNDSKSVESKDEKMYRMQLKSLDM